MIARAIFATALALVPLSSSAWQYQEQSDKMRGAKTKHASIDSSNSVQFGFPYGGGSTLELYLRKSPKYGSGVILQISKGQFTCFMECTVHVKFDGEKIERYGAAGAADGSSNVIFIQAYSRFVSKIRKAKKC